MRAPTNLLAGASLVLLSGIALVATAGLEGGRLRAMGPGMMPRGVAVLVLAIGVGLVVASFVRSGAALERWSLRGPLFITLGVVAFALTIRTVGLVVAGPLVAMVGGAAARDARPKELFVFSLAVTAFCVLLFRYALRLPIPVVILPGILVI